MKVLIQADIYGSGVKSYISNLIILRLIKEYKDQGHYISILPFPNETPRSYSLGKEVDRTINPYLLKVSSNIDSLIYQFDKQIVIGLKQHCLPTYLGGVALGQIINEFIFLDDFDQSIFANCLYTKGWRSFISFQNEKKEKGVIFCDTLVGLEVYLLDAIKTVDKDKIDIILPDMVEAQVELLSETLSKNITKELDLNLIVGCPLSTFEYLLTSCESFLLPYRG